MHRDALEWKRLRTEKWKKESDRESRDNARRPQQSLPSDLSFRPLTDSIHSVCTVSFEYFQTQSQPLIIWTVSFECSLPHSQSSNHLHRYIWMRPDSFLANSSSPERFLWRPTRPSTRTPPLKLWNCRPGPSSAASWVWSPNMVLDNNMMRLGRRIIRWRKN